MFDSDEQTPQYFDGYPIKLIAARDLIRVRLPSNGWKLIDWSNIEKLKTEVLKNGEEDQIPVRMFRTERLGPASATFIDPWGNVHVLHYQIVEQTYAPE